MSPHPGGAGHVAPAHSHGFAPPANPIPPSHAGQVGRSGHWPSWNGGGAIEPHRQPARERYPYVYPGLLSFGYGLPGGYGFAAGNDQAEAGFPPPQPDSAEDYGPLAPDAQSAQAAPPLYRTPYQGSMEPPTALAPVHPQPATILIFKDGRPQRQVHNYALLGTTLWALDGETRQEIPIETLDVPATLRANREAGIDFALPGSR